MSRKAFTRKDVDRSPILRTLSGNLELIRRMEDLTMTEFAKMVGVSDRFLNELIRQETNVSILILEQIAARLRMPLMTLIGTRLEVRIPGAETGFLRSLQHETPRHAGQSGGDLLSREQKPARREASHVSGSLNVLLTEIMESQNKILQNQFVLKKQLAELDTWLNGNLMLNRSGQAAAIQ
jgi:transcriptional regulator with XRE-family HTH domain